MKSVVLVALGLVALAIATPVDVEPVKILRSDFQQQPDGAYVYSFDTEDGISRSETGEVKSVVDEENKPQNVVVVRGSYSYTDEDGKPVVVTYEADETGFHAEGDVIPKPVRR